MSEAPDALTVAYVAGLGRSGSTLLDRLLGQLPGHVAVGELVYLWSHSVLLDHECGCRRPFSECPFWQEVGRRAFGPRAWEAVDAKQLAESQQSLDQTGRIPSLVLPRLNRRFRAKLLPYAEVMGRVYAAIAAVSGAAVVVDSSKYPGPLYLLRQVPGVRVHAIHIVRDPRGVAYSWSRTVRRPERDNRLGEDMPLWPVRLSARRWLTTNLLVGMLPALRTPRMLLRYEDLVEQPRQQLRRIASFVGVALPDSAPSYIEGTTAHLVATHTVDGNPMRFVVGEVPIVLDEKWRTSFTGRDRRLVDLLTWPMRLRYGYR
jgi:hypothetical protein